MISIIVERISAVFLCLLCLFPSSLFANGSPIRIKGEKGSVGTITPVQSSQIALAEETVDLQICPIYTVGRVHYILRNDGPTTEVLFGFPTSGDLSYDIRLNGKPVPSENKKKLSSPITRAFEFSRYRKYIPIITEWLSAGGYLEDTRQIFRYHFWVTPIRFDAGETVTVDITFMERNWIVNAEHFAPSKEVTTMDGSTAVTTHTGFSYFRYLLTPAQNWKGSIGKAYISITPFGYPVFTDKADTRPIILPEPHHVEGQKFTWTFENLDPKEDLEIFLPYRFYNVYSGTGKSYSHDWEYYGILAKNVLDIFGDALVPSSAISKVTASSERAKNAKGFFSVSSVKKAFDRIPFATGWMNDKSEGNGTGAELSVEFASPQSIAVIGIIPGYTRKGIVNTTYARPKKIELTCDDGEKQVIGLEDRIKTFPYVLHQLLQLVPLNTPVQCSKIRMKIIDVYPGRNKNNPVVISEIIFLVKKVYGFE